MPHPLTFAEMVALVKRSSEAFLRVQQRPWTIETEVIELMKQVGDLAKRVMVFERYYLPDRDKHPAYRTSLDNIGNELADILYCVIRIALYYRIDLEDAHRRARDDELGYAAQAAAAMVPRPAMPGDQGTQTTTAMQTETVRAHYETLLAARYDWMLGGDAQAEAKAAALIETLNLVPREGAKVLDLGCGSGLHAKALAQKGVSVRGVDLSPTLLECLRVRCQGLPVAAIEGDLRDVSAYQGEAPYALILCLGDSVTHLECEEDVVALVRHATSLLEPGGQLVFGFRDMTVELEGIDRLLTPRSDPDRILSVFLEYEPDHVWVNDVVHERSPEGWRSIRGRYRKLRLAPQRVVAMMEAVGLHPLQSVVVDGLVHVSARK